MRTNYILMLFVLAVFSITNSVLSKLAETQLSHTIAVQNAVIADQEQTIREAQGTKADGFSCPTPDNSLLQVIDKHDTNSTIKYSLRI